ncbi:MAG: hypothetical protein ACRDTV_12120 [Mycobacterium sp.]
MTVLVAMCALAAATGFGYYVGRRATSTPSTWRKRTSRVALGRLAVGLLVAVAARHIRRRFALARVLSDAIGIRGMRTAAPLELWRGGVARLRSY